MAKKELEDEEKKEPKESEAEDPKEAEDDQRGNSVANPRAETNKDQTSAMLDLFFSEVEVTSDTSSYVGDSQKKPYNPDPIVERSQDYQVYTDMGFDDQVSVAMELKKDLILASGYEFVRDDKKPDPEDEKEEQEGEEAKPAPGGAYELDPDQESDEEMPEDPEAEASEKKKAEEDSKLDEITEFLKIAFCEDPDTSFDESLEDILTAYDYGFSLSEKVFKHRPDGKLTIKSLKTRHPGSWLIHTDDYSNVTRYEQRNQKQSIDVNPKALIHYINRARFRNPYGTSDLRAAYPAYFVKKQIIKFYSIFMEKAASPTPVARYDKAAPQAAVDAIYAAIKKLQTKTAIAIPKEIEIEFLEAKGSGDVYQKAINIFNMFIGRALMIPDLLGFQGSETSGGSYSLGKDQIQILFKHIHKRRTTVEKIINKEFVQPLVFYNFGFVENYPKFKLKPIQDEQLVDLAKLWLEAVKGKVWKPSDEEVNHFRSLAKFPQGIVDREAPPPAFGGGAVDPETGEPMPQDPNDPNAKGKQPGQPFGGKSKNNKPAKGQPKPGKSENGNPSGKPTKKFKAVNHTEYMKKMDFKMIGRTMDSASRRVVDEIKPITDKIFDELIQQVKTKKIVQSQNPDKIDSLTLKHLSEIEGIFRRKFREAFKDGQRIAKAELEKGAYKENGVLKTYAEPALPSGEFLKVLESENYSFIRDWEYSVKKRVRLELIAAIKDGKPIRDVEGILDNLGDELTDVQMERYARTKFTEVMNRGRLDYFDSSGVVAAYQYSAILDDRTSDLCAGLDEKIFPAGEQPIPPLHFNAVTSDTLIRMDSGWKPISSVKIGDLVFTHSGKAQRVYDVMSKFEDKEYFEIQLNDGKVLKATGEHPILTSRGWIRTDELKESDHIVTLQEVNNDLLIR